MQKQNNPSPRRIAWVFLIFCLAFTLLIGHLFWIQLIQGRDWQQKASQMRTKSKVLTSRRGLIMDRNGNKLATNIKVNSIYADPHMIDSTEQAAKDLSLILGVNKKELYEKLNKNTSFVWIKRKVDYETSQKIRELQIKGLGFIEENKRLYPDGQTASHVLGFTGMDYHGLQGIEKSLDEELQGEAGDMLAEYGAKGRKIPGSTSRYKEPVPGNNIVLTLDKHIQYFVERELNSIVKTYNPKLAVALVMDPKTGEILAMGNQPTFNPNRWNDSPEEIWDNNPAIWYNYEPGSIFKIITAAAALEEGSANLESKFFDPGYVDVDGQKIKSWKQGGHGSQTFLEIMLNSCNPGFVKVGLTLGRERFYKYIEGFGFGNVTGVKLPGEAGGILIPESQATDLNIATQAIGQSIAVTPLQLIKAVSAVANGGKLMKPQLVKKIVTSGGEIIHEYQPKVERQVISAKTSQEMRSILEKVVTDGTGKQAYLDGYRVAGKTGTAEVAGDSGYVNGQYISSFVGFAPANNPRVTILIMIAEPKGDIYHGGLVAAPSFKAIASDTLRYLRIHRNYN